MEIKYNNFGIGMLCIDKKGNKWIEINEKVKEFPKFHDMIVKHEKRHFDNHETGTKEFMYDFKEDMIFMVKSTKESLPFLFKYPKHFIEASLPILKSKEDGWGINPTGLLFYLLTGFLFGIIVWG